MNDYEQILSLIDDERVKAGLSTNKDLGTKFTLGQTRFMWRHGTLSDGHEKITDAQRYYQANKEIYVLSGSIEEQRYRAMAVKADQIDAQEALERAKTQSETLRAQSALGSATSALRRCLDTIQDQLRGLHELCMIKDELEPKVMAKYPQGIEQAEPDNWKAVAEYRLIKERLPGMARADIAAVPMDPITKAQLGRHYNRIDAIAPLLVNNSELLRELGANTADEAIAALLPEPQAKHELPDTKLHS
jgi:hypothetical protein